MPAYLAKALSLGKRSTLAASEINLAAVNSAHPGSVGRVDPEILYPADYPRGQRVDVLTEHRHRSATSSAASSACNPDCSPR